MALRKIEERLRNIFVLQPNLIGMLDFHQLFNSQPGDDKVSLHPCWKSLYELVAKTVESAESNSVLVVGPSGCGKTTIIESVIRAACPDDKAAVVRLSGAVHADSRLALRSIARQLGFEADVTEGQSHAEILLTVLSSMRSGGTGRETAKSIILVLNEMDRFCHHKQQSLLYNVLDIAQSLHTPLCVVGVSTRLDVVELLEKRVKSRFSHRQLLVTPMKTMEEVTQAAEGMLSLPETFHLSERRKWNEKIAAAMKTEAVRKAFSQFASLYGDFVSLQNLLIPIAVQLSKETRVSEFDFAGQITKRLVADARSSMLRGLSNLELHLLQVMILLRNRLDDEPFNFALVHKEYANQCSKRGGIKGSDKAVAKKAFERLQALELITPVDSGTTVLPDYRLHRAQLTPEHVTLVQTLLPNQIFELVH